MNKMVSKLALAAGLVLALAFMASCVGDDSSAFIGKWILEDGSESIELFKDGTGVAQERQQDKSISISWKVVENRRFVVTTSSKAHVFDYEISGRILTLTDDKGKRERFFKPQEGKIEGKTLTDNRDGKKYKTVIIGAQIWMAENLNYNAEGSKCYGEGGKIIIDVDDKGKPTATKTLSDKEIRQMCENYGRLYDWTTAKKACPSGWHLPSKNEWEKLTDFIGGEKIADKKLKSNSGWNENGSGTDDFGFSALPGGLGYSDGNFGSVNNYGSWWSASEYDSNFAFFRIMHYNYGIARWGYNFKSILRSVRCVQN